MRKRHACDALACVALIEVDGYHANRVLSIAVVASGPVIAAAVDTL